MKGAVKISLWAGRLIFWPIALYLVLTLVSNFLTAPLGLKSKDLPASTTFLAWIAVGTWALSFFVKRGVHDGYAEGYGARSELSDEGLKKRRLSEERALAIHGDLIAEAKRLCAKEDLVSDEFGCPEPYETWINDDSPTAKVKFKAAKRVAEEYQAILLEDLRNAIGVELMSKLGEPDKYLYPQAGPGHQKVLAYCNLEFKRVDKSLFDGLPLPEDREPNRRNAGVIAYDRSIEVSHTASFGIFDPGFGEQYIPGDLRIIVGVKTVNDVTSYYSPWRYQVNPTAKNFLKELVDLESLPVSAASASH